MLGITQEQLLRSFDPITLHRGRAYVAQDRVTVQTVERDDEGFHLRGTARGSARRPYDVDVWLTHGPLGADVDGMCSCPVGDNCKHSAALVLAAMASGPRGAKPAWERELGELLGQLEGRSESAGRTVPLALRVDHRLVTTNWSPPRHSLTLHPMRPGKKDAWIKTGASWNDVQYSMAYSRHYDPAQVEVLQGILGLQRGTYGQAPDLGRLSPTIWPLLHQAVARGITLLPGNGLVDVELVEAVEVESDLAADAEGNLTVGFRLRGSEGGDETTTLLGEPAHGVALLHPAPPPGSRRSAHYRLVLAPLASAVPRAAERLLTEGRRLVVPRDERAAFERDYLPRLRRQVATASRDGSVQLPEIEPPRLALTVAWTGLGVVETTWSWRYRLGEHTREFRLDSHDGHRDVRDATAEEQILADLHLDIPELTEEGRLVVSRIWRDAGLIAFTDDVLPALREAAAEGTFDLDEAGERPDYRAAEQAPAVSFGIEEGDEGAKNDWLDLSVTITVEGEQVPVSRVLAALTHGDDVVFTDSGLHVRTDHPALQQLAELVAAAGQIVDQPTEGVRVGRHDLALWADLADLGVVDEQAEQWVASARALRDFTGLPDVPLDGVRSSLRPYQYDGVRWLAFLWQSGLGGILADDMGLGKTLQTLALIAHARREGAAPFLVVAPTSVVGNWVHEAAQHTGLTVRGVTASAAKRAESLAEVHDGADIVVTSYTLFRLEADAYSALEWGGLVLDEAQHVKNHQGKTYHAVRRLDVPFRLALTGTPFENRLMELWALLSIVTPGLYPWPAKFAELVAKPAEARGDRQALDRFRRRIRPFMLRRTKELVATELPPKQEQVLEVVLNARHRRIYDTHLQRERQTILGLVDDFKRNRVAIFGALTRLRQLSLDPALVDPAHDKVGSAKIDVLVDSLAEIVEEGHRALVFSQFTTFLRRVRDRLHAAGITTSYLDGRTRNRAAAIEGFKTGTDPVFLISLKAGGTGLTLTEADYVFVLDPWWNPATEAQAVDRTHRIGQTEQVMVYRLVATDTIEEKVMELKARKAALFSQVLDNGGALTGELTADDVRALFE